MELLLAVLSGLLLWLFLGVLLWALGRVGRALAGINASLARIAWGVRAIESQTAILRTELPTTASSLAQIADGGELIAARLGSAETRLAQAAP